MATSTAAPFWCHSCQSIVTIQPSDDHMTCPFCRNGFVEEINNNNSNNGEALPSLASPATAAVFVAGDFSSTNRSRASRSQTFRSRRPLASEILSFLSRRSRRVSHGHGGDSVDIADHLHSLFNSRRGRPISRRDWLEFEFGYGEAAEPASGFNIRDRLQRFFSRRRRRSSTTNSSGFGHGSGSHSHSGRLAEVRDFQDFLSGPGGDLFIQQLIEGAGTGIGGGFERRGSAPASKAAIDAMPIRTVGKQSFKDDGESDDDDNNNNDDVHCAVCKEIFETGGEAREMPCKHVYHSQCILPWLAKHNSCPICRHEMPSEEPSTPESQRVNDGSSLGMTFGGNGGERGLAIVGIPGIGVQIRSFMLFGIRNTDNSESPEVQGQVPSAQHAAPAPNHQPESIHSNDSLSNDSDVSMQLSTSYNTSSSDSQSRAPDDSRRRIRSFMSWLRGSNSARSHSHLIGRSMNSYFTRGCLRF